MHDSIAHLARLSVTNGYEIKSNVGEAAGQRGCKVGRRIRWVSGEPPERERRESEAKKRTARVTGDGTLTEGLMTISETDPDPCQGESIFEGDGSK